LESKRTDLLVEASEELMMPVPVTRLPLRLTPDATRVITRFFCPGDIKRTKAIIDRVLAFPESEVEDLLADLEGGFRIQHPDLRAFFADHFEQIRANIPSDIMLTRDRQLLLGACFTMDYALEAVALFNPSMVPALIQEGVQPGAIRFLMSLRATGEGHLSSIVFRTGIIDETGDVRLDAPGTYSRPLKASVPDHFRKSTFRRDLAAMGIPENHFAAILDRLDENFTRTQLGDAIDAVRQNQATSGFLEETADTLISLSRVNYQLHIPHVPQVFRELEIVIFPFSDLERHGIEDLRLVRFTDDDGTQVYFGTFTAYDGGRVYPKLLEFRGGTTIDISLMTGECAKNKGMALFPERIGGKYAMISRIDNENLYYMESDDVLVWNEAQLLQAPKFPWQVIQLGNCGSPIETEAGWLLITHGVGPMRQYCIGASLLDREQPCRVIGQTREPLLIPTDEERSGYVPNVVYSCGAMVHNGMLIIPYAMSDLATSVARVDLAALLSAMQA
jgi:predicted GH43/DUF377 family glycosyl hydrolase